MATPTAVISSKEIIATSKATPTSGLLRLFLRIVFIGFVPYLFGFRRWPIPLSSTRRSEKVLLSREGACTMMVIPTSRISAGVLAAVHGAGVLPTTSQV